jgi:hypothetical protein
MMNRYTVGIRFARKTLEALWPSLLVMGVIDMGAIAAYYLLPDHSAGLALSNGHPLGVVTHIFSHASALHVWGNAVLLLFFPIVLAFLGFMGAEVMGRGDHFLSFVGRWTVPLFFVSACMSGAVAFITLSATGRPFTFAGMSDGVYGVAVGLACAGFIETMSHVKHGRFPAAPRVITVFLMFLVFWAIVESALGNLGHILGALSAIALVGAVDLADSITPVLLAAMEAGNRFGC